MRILMNILRLASLNIGHELGLLKMFCVLGNHSNFFSV